MGNTYLRERTRGDLDEYTDANKYKSSDDAVMNLLAESKMLKEIKRECELLERLFEAYKLFEKYERERHRSIGESGD